MSLVQFMTFYATVVTYLETIYKRSETAWLKILELYALFVNKVPYTKSAPIKLIGPGRMNKTPGMYGICCCNIAELLLYPMPYLLVP